MMRRSAIIPSLLSGACGGSGEPRVRSSPPCAPGDARPTAKLRTKSQTRLRLDSRLVDANSSRRGRNPALCLPGDEPEHEKDRRKDEPVDALPAADAQDLARR